MNLNPEQQAAVDSEAPRRLILASPGSGKTATLVAAVAREAKEHGAGGIVVISYTNQAAMVLQERLAALGVTGLGACSTLHAFLFRCLREWEPQALSVIDDSQREGLLTSVMEDLGVKGSIKHILPLTEEAGEPINPSKYDLVVKEYRQRLAASGLVDFASILHRGCSAVIGLAKAGRWPYKSLFVDEAQDGSRTDWYFYWMPYFERKLLVGDPNQCIYEQLRGACSSIMVKQAEAAGNPKVPEPRWELHELTDNYRSGVQICNAANRLIRHNRNRHPMDMVSASMLHNEVKVHRCANPAAEMSFVLESIMQGCGFTTGNEIAVLCRTNHQAREFAQHFKANGCHVTTVEQPKRPPDWRETKLLLTVLANPFCDLAVLRLIEATECPQDAQRLREAAALRMVSVNEVLGHRYGNACGSDLGIDGLKRLDQFGVSSESRELVHTACRELGKRGQWGLGDLIVYIGEQDACARTVGEGVRVSTIHSAKGTEASVVFVVGCEDGLLPSAKDAADPASLEESRRLLYVAATRAKRSLTLTWCCERPEYRGENVPCGPMRKRERSRFLDEMELP